MGEKMWGETAISLSLSLVAGSRGLVIDNETIKIFRTKREKVSDLFFIYSRETKGV